MSQQTQKDSNQHGNFNLLHEELRGAMYGGGAERETVYKGHVLGFLAMGVLQAFGLICALASFGVVLWWAQRRGIL